LLYLREAVAGDQRLEIGELVAETAAQVDNSLRRDGAVAGALCSSETGELHKR
jgi:hypothetical protein